MFTPVYEYAFPCVPLEIYNQVQTLTSQRLAGELRGSVRDSELQMAIMRLNALKAHLDKVPHPDLSTLDGYNNCVSMTRNYATQMVAKGGQATYTNYFSMLMKAGA